MAVIRLKFNARIFAARVNIQVPCLSLAATMLDRSRKLPEVQLTAEQIIFDAASLTVSDRLRVAEAIWDSLPDGANPTPDPEIKAEFDHRMANYRQNPETAMTIDELRARLDADRTK